MKLSNIIKGNKETLIKGGLIALGTLAGIVTLIYKLLSACTDEDETESADFDETEDFDQE